MKYILFFVQVVIFSLLTVLSVSAHASNAFDDPSNYVVIGAFAIESNAIQFTNIANTQKLEAKVEINPKRNLYYVYVLESADLQQAKQEAVRLRKETKFSDAWVFTGQLGIISEPITQKSMTDINPVSEFKIEEVQPKDISATSNDSVAERKQVTVVPKNESPVEDNTSGIKGKNFFFKLYRATNNEIVEGDVDVIDAEKSRKLGSYKGNGRVKIPAPPSKSSDVLLQCAVFGYRKVQRNINYENPEGDDILKDQNNVIVPFELVRLQAGDIAVMYNVFFFKDAGIMRPESRYEVDNLLAMLKENPNYKIKIHGHTNGNSHGRIISMGEGGDFFSLTNSKDSFGSAKELSEERAKIISSYLVANGIDASRMLIKAWGGKRPIYDKRHARASENVRVEVEILEN